MILAIYKPKGPTSHDIVDQVRQLTGIKKVGHAGTLDPLAEGVLVVGIGRQATKQLGKIVKKDKEYLATIRLGATSTTDDAQGLKHHIAIKTPPAKEAVEQALQTFVGQIKQIPPVYSAVKIKGKPAHRLTRQGKKVTLKPRQVVIHKIRLVRYNYPILKIKVATGPGVYIRSLARDLGEKLQTGGYLAKLVRTCVGRFTLDQAIRVVKLAPQKQK